MNTNNSSNEEFISADEASRILEAAARDSHYYDGMDFDSVAIHSEFFTDK